MDSPKTESEGSQSPGPNGHLESIQETVKELSTIIDSLMKLDPTRMWRHEENQDFYSLHSVMIELRDWLKEELDRYDADDDE
jgi:hypothetical protein